MESQRVGHSWPTFTSLQTFFRLGSGGNTVAYSGPHQTSTAVEPETRHLHRSGFPGARKLAWWRNASCPQPRAQRGTVDQDHPTMSPVVSQQQSHLTLTACVFLVFRRLWGQPWVWFFMGTMHISVNPQLLDTTAEPAIGHFSAVSPLNAICSKGVFLSWLLICWWIIEISITFGSQFSRVETSKILKMKSSPVAFRQRFAWKASGLAAGRLCSMVSEMLSAMRRWPPAGHCRQPGAPALPGHLLDTQTPRCGLHLLIRICGRAWALCLNKPSGTFWCTDRLGNPGLDVLVLSLPIRVWCPRVRALGCCGQCAL